MFFIYGLDSPCFVDLRHANVGQFLLKISYLDELLGNLLLVILLNHVDFEGVVVS